MKKQFLFFLFALSLYNNAQEIYAQPEWRPWGNIAGLRVDGQLMPFETSLRAVDQDWGGYVATEKYNTEGRIDYRVIENGRYTYHWLEKLPLYYSSIMKDKGRGKALHEFQVEAKQAIKTAGLYYCVELNSDEFEGATVKVSSRGKEKASAILGKAISGGKKWYLKEKGNSITIESNDKTYVFSGVDDVEIIVRQDFLGHPHYLNDPYPRQRFVDSDPVQETFDYKKEVADYQIYITIAQGNLNKGYKKTVSYDIKTEGYIDRESVELTLDVTKPGRTFDGISGNFRWQFPDKDPKVIDYNLDNLRVTWGRVAFFWDEWHPQENMDPIENAKAGKLSERFRKQMEVTGLLAKKNIPIMVSVWAPPQWAVDPIRKNKRGVILDNSKIQQISQSIADYLLYIKQVYGVETITFSFNESDVGVEVFQTAEDHQFISQALVECFRKNGLQTKILLGDTGHGTAQANHNILRVVEKDPNVYKYGYALSFHTYHGCQPRDIAAWKRSAEITNLPIIVAEGGPDSSAHRYEKMFLDEWFQLSEIDLYIRLCAGVQPFSIMPWQLTKDYSVLIGDGIYGDNGVLRPTMRFWNLKQLGMSPEKAFWMPIKASKENVTVAANGDIAEGIYTVHVVNNGPARKMILKGLPASVTELRLFTTNIDKGMEEGNRVKVINGVVEFEVEELSYVTLINN